MMKNEPGNCSFADALKSRIKVMLEGDEEEEE